MNKLFIFTLLTTTVLSFMADARVIVGGGTADLAGQQQDNEGNEEEKELKSKGKKPSRQFAQ